MDDYDVFLNHRGPDVKGAFISHLHEALKSAGLKPFLDKISLVKGDPASASMDAALQETKVHVAVVSEGYADSKCPLIELAAMMRSGKPVIPVFYGVEPAQLRHVEKGLFASAFEKHKSREETAEVEEWAEALGKLADTTGFLLSDYKENEAQLKRKVVDMVLKRMPTQMPTHEDLLFGQHLVGVEDHLKTCINKLQHMSGATSLLGLFGLGGVGKTTLAKVIYGTLGRSGKFQGMSFLMIDQNTPSSIEPSILGRLQMQLLWDLHVLKNSPRSFEYCPRIYKNYWLRELSEKGPILIVIDNIQDTIQFDELILDISLLAPGSCIIVTSRDQHHLNVIANSKKMKHYLHKVLPLECSDSKKLFNWHAFGMEEAPPKFEVSADKISNACGGLPLALKVVGLSLSDKRSDEDLECIWPEAVDALHKDPKIMSALEWSYRCLTSSEQLMFVDIACAFYGWTKEEALELWLDCKYCSCELDIPHTSLQALVDKSMVDIQKHASGSRLVMHSLLQDIGQSIGSTLGSHLSKHQATKMVEDKCQVGNTVRALNLSNNTRQNVNGVDFAKFINLHFLILDGCDGNGDLKNIFKTLRWLRWRYMPLQQLPSILNLSNLISLDFSDSTMLADTWAKSDPALEACPNLLRLNLSGCTSIVTLPNSIGHLSQLRLLDLRHCVKLHHLPSSIGQLTALQELLLGWCESLEALPESISKLSSLQWLFLKDCSSLSTLPHSIRHMESLIGVNANLTTTWQARAIGQFNNTLTKLWAWHVTDKAVATLDSSLVLTNLDHLTMFGFVQCLSMTKLPQSIGFLSSLEFLELNGCAKVQLLPNSIGDLKALQQLRLKNCDSLKTLPNSLGAMASLQNLLISNCPAFIKLPSSIGNLSSLREVDIQGCGELKPLPISFKQLHELVYLAIIDCGELENLGILRVLHGLCMWACISITKLSGSCLIVEDIDFKNPTFGMKFEGQYSIPRRLRKREEVTKDKIDNNVGTYYIDENVEDFYPVRRKLKEVKVVETTDCGLLRTVQDDKERTILQRLYKSPCQYL